MYVTVKSNGTLAHPDAVSTLTDAGANAMDISLYGATAATHDVFVKASGAFDKTLRGAHAARAAGLRVKFSFVIVRGNAGEVEAMIALAEKMGIAYSLDPQITARYDGSRSSLDLRVDPDTLEGLYRGPLRHLIPPPDPRPNRSVQCACARSVCGISALGEVYPCIGAPVPSGNLRQHSFAEIWKSSAALNHIRGLRLADFKACQPCEHRPYCRRSSGVIYNNTGDYTGPAELGGEWTCQEAEVLHRIHDDGVVEKAPASAGALRRHSVDVP
jgi:radical SAM protein with 4Fe4S-binding SPASM domain